MGGGHRRSGTIRGIASDTPDRCTRDQKPRAEESHLTLDPFSAPRFPRPDPPCQRQRVSMAQRGTSGGLKGIGLLCLDPPVDAAQAAPFLHLARELLTLSVGV